MTTCIESGLDFLMNYLIAFLKCKISYSIESFSMKNVLNCLQTKEWIRHMSSIA